MTKTLKLSLAALPLALALACTDANKAPAEAAMKAAETAVAALNDDVTRLAPEQAKAARDDLANAKVAIAKSDFKAARPLAEGVKAKVDAAVAAAAAKKEALAKEAAAKAAEAKKAYDAAAPAITKKVDSLKKYVAGLLKTKKFPKGVTKADAAKAKETVAGFEASLAAAKAQSSTDAAAALAAAKEVEAKAADLGKSLKMK